MGGARNRGCARLLSYVDPNDERTLNKECPDSEALEICSHNGGREKSFSETNGLTSRETG